MVARFDREITKWMDGTEGLDHAEYRAYDVVLNLIYLNDGPIVAHESGIAGRCKMHPLKFRAALASLVAMGKLVIGTDGKIMNPKAEKELKKIDARRAKRSADPGATPASPRAHPEGDTRGSGGGTGGGKASKPLKNKTPHVDADRLPVRSGPVRSVESAKADSVPAVPADDWPEDFVEQFWQRYPPRRKTAKKTVTNRLMVIRKNREVTWEKLMAGLDRYIASEPGEYAKAPVVWLNGGCWDDEFGEMTLRDKRASPTKGNGFAAIRRKLEEIKHHGGS